MFVGWPDWDLWHILFILTDITLNAPKNVDVTAPLQKLIDRYHSLDLKGRTFYVTCLKMPSNCTIQNRHRVSLSSYKVLKINNAESIKLYNFGSRLW